MHDVMVSFQFVLAVVVLVSTLSSLSSLSVFVLIYGPD